MEPTINSRRINSDIAALLAAALVGMLYGSVTGALFALPIGCILTTSSSTPALTIGAAVAFGCIWGAVGGGVAGLIGASFNSFYGWGVAGFIGGLVAGFYLIIPPMLGAWVGTFVSNELEKQTSSVPLLNWLRDRLKQSNLAAWPIWKRAVVSLTISIIFGAFTVAVIQQY